MSLDYKPDINLKTTFDTAAKQYEEARIGYPDPLFDKLIKVTRIDVDSYNLLEIGSGTGKATKSLAKRGYKILAVEPGVEMTNIAREILKPYPNVEILNSTFEDAQLEPNSYDLIFAAESFHWVDPEIKWKKTHQVLKPNGYLALIWHGRVSDDNGDSLFYEMREIVQRLLPHLIESPLWGKPPKKLSEIPPPDDFDKNFYELVAFESSPTKETMTTEDMIKMLGTISHIIALDEATKDEFYREVRKVGDEKFGGKIDIGIGNHVAIFKAK